MSIPPMILSLIADSQKYAKAHSLHISFQKGRTVANPGVTEALEDPKWKEAMNEEMRALQKNVTWEIVPLPHGKKTVGCNCETQSRWIH
ncbi:unnamed protein product [Prunus armeniaca]